MHISKPHRHSHSHLADKREKHNLYTRKLTEVFFPPRKHHGIHIAEAQGGDRPKEQPAGTSRKPRKNMLQISAVVRKDEKRDGTCFSNTNFCTWVEPASIHPRRVSRHLQEHGMSVLYTSLLSFQKLFSENRKMVLTAFGKVRAAMNTGDLMKVTAFQSS